MILGKIVRISMEKQNINVLIDMRTQFSFSETLEIY